MSHQPPEPPGPLIGQPAASAGDLSAPADAATRILRRLLRGFDGNGSLRLWNDSAHRMGQGPSAFTLVLRDPLLLRSLVTAPDPLRLADAYFHGQVDIEGDIFSALALKDHFESLVLPWRDKLSMLRDAWDLPTHVNQGPRPPMRSRLTRCFTGRHSRQSDSQAIAFHDDVSNDFYGLWLDSERVYSCAYFENPGDTLERAQAQKLAHICRKLRLRKDERLLDIGCGWGALICWAARHHGVRAHGITLSQAQHDYAQQRINDEGLKRRVTVELCDYRDLPDSPIYDKVASIGMFEHVGLRNMGGYLAAVRRVLRPGGLFLNHGITHDEEGWGPSVGAAFINRYVFPDGELDCVSNIQLGMERAGFEIQDVEALRRHYALTLRHWVHRLEAQHEVARTLVDEATYRVWRLYMAACALAFESGGTGVYQILASRRGDHPNLPLTRRDLYTPVVRTQPVPPCVP